MAVARFQPMPIRLVHEHERVPSTVPYVICHWCRGDGLHPFVPQRWRQTLSQWLEIGDRVSDTGERYRGRTIEGVSFFRPFRLWHTEVLVRLAGGMELPYELPDFGKLCCPRCHGWGERYGAERHAEQVRERG